MKSPRRLLPALPFLPILFLLSAFPVLGAAPAADQTGRIIFADGEVTANGRTADTGDVLAGSTVLKTGPASAVEVLFGGKNIFRLGPNTLVKIDFSELKKSVSLQQGEFTSVLKKLARSVGDPSFLLRTPTVAAGVRGTSFHASVAAGRTYFCTCNGSVELDGGTGALRMVLTNAHHGSRIFTQAPDGTVSAAEGGLEGHTDASIVALAGKIGWTVDWTQPDLDH